MENLLLFCWVDKFLISFLNTFVYTHRLVDIAGQSSLNEAPRSPSPGFREYSGREAEKTLKNQRMGGSSGARRSGHDKATALLNPQHLWLPAQDWASQPSTFHHGLGKVSGSPASPPGALGKGWVLEKSRFL